MFPKKKMVHQTKEMFKRGERKLLEAKQAEEQALETVRITREQERQRFLQMEQEFFERNPNG
jgi:hypothetical protein